jgi:hypothetical protein
MIDFNSAPLQDELRTRDDDFVADIRARLMASVESFVTWIFPGRVLIGRGEARIGNIMGDAGESLSICLAGPNAGQWNDFATGEKGDLISLYRGYMRYYGTVDFILSLKEIAKDFFRDQIEVERAPWQMPSAKIAEDKVRLGTKPRDNEGLGASVAQYRYFDINGIIIAKVLRYEPDGTRNSKTFRPFCLKMGNDGKPRWTAGVPDIRPLYRLPEIASALSVVLVEGEGCADALVRSGIEATTAMSGANAPLDKTDWSVMAGKTVAIWPDNDLPGLNFGKKAADKLLTLGCRVLMVQVPAAKAVGWDAADCVGDGEDPLVLLDAAVEVVGQTKPSGNLYDYLDIKQIKAKPDPVWLIDGLVNERSLGFIYGPPGSLKTFIALSMALGFATGRSKWWEREIRREGAVIYLCREGTSSLKFRIMAWEQHHKVVADDGPFYLIEKSINFMKPEDIGVLLATVQDIVDRIRGPVAAVFVDTVSRVLPGARENLQDDMSLFVDACEAVQRAFGCVVFGVHHTNKAGGFRGSTVMPGAGDFLIEVRREPGAMTGSIFAAKIKDSEDGWEQSFRVEKIEVAEGKVSLVVDPMLNPSAAAGGGSGWPSRAVCIEILAAVHEQWIKGQPWCFAANSSRAAVPNIMKRWNLKRSVVVDILQSWNARGVVEETVHGTHNHVTGYRKLVDL